MTSFFRNLVNRCLPCTVRQETVELSSQSQRIDGKEGLSNEELFFVIPTRDFPKYEARRPESGSELSVGQYMFLYQYLTAEEYFKQPSAEHEWVMYFFKDRGCIHLMKGWVPTKKGFEKFIIREKKVISFIEEKVKLSRMTTGDQMRALNLKTSSSVKNLENRYKNENTVVYPDMPARKSAYDWGVVGNWSRHVALETDKNAPFEFVHGQNKRIYSEESMDLLSEEINAVIEGKSLKGLHAPRKCGSNGMVTSTIDTRNRRIRPGAAKGPRKPPPLCDKYMLKNQNV